MDEKIRYFKINEYEVFVDSNEIRNQELTHKLTPKEMQVLTNLYKNAGKTILRNELIATIWGTPFGNDLGLTQAISKLRQIFKDDLKKPQYIKTIPKKGYQFLVQNGQAYASAEKKEVPPNFKSKILGKIKTKYVVIITILLLIVLILLLLPDTEIRIRKIMF